MANNLWSTDNTTNKFYRHSGFTSTILTSFSTPSSGNHGVSSDGTNLYSSDSNTDKIYKHSGFTSVILDSFSSPGTSPNDVTFFGSNIYSNDNTGKVYKHSGFSSVILNSFSTNSNDGLSYSTVNLLGTNDALDDVFKHNGFTSTILDSFSAPADNPYGVTFDGRYYYTSSQFPSSKLYKHNGFNATVLDSFTSPNNSPQGIEWEGVSRIEVPNFSPAALSLGISLPQAFAGSTTVLVPPLNLYTRMQRLPELAQNSTKIIFIG